MSELVKHDPVDVVGADVTMIVGIRGTGKTEFLKNSVLRPYRGRIIAWDPHGELTRDMHGRPLLQRVEWDDFLDSPFLNLNAPDLRIAVYPGDVEPDELARRFVAFIAIVRHSEDYLLAIEEIGQLEGESKALKKVTYAATQSRHWGPNGVPVVLSAQCAVQIPKKAHRQTSHIISFAQRDPDDIDALAKRIGREKAERVKLLPRFQCVRWHERQALDAQSGEEKPRGPGKQTNEHQEHSRDGSHRVGGDGDRGSDPQAPGLRSGRVAATA